MNINIPFIKPTPPSLNKIKKDLLRVYTNGIFTNMGPFEKKFEMGCRQFFRDKSGNPPYVVTVANATMGLILALNALKPRQKYVLLPSFTFAASIEAIIWSGFTPVFVDIYKNSWSMSINSKVINFMKRGKVGAVLYGNPFGIPGKIDEWEKLTQKYEIPMLVDSAAGMGSLYADGTPMGLKGNAEVFSLHITKTFGIGEGGLVVTKNEKLADSLQRMKNFGFDENHVVQVLGTNAKMPEFSSVIGLHVLKSYKSVLSKKRALMKVYIDDLAPQIEIHEHILLSAGQFFPILFPDSKLRVQKEIELDKRGIKTRRYYYPPLHQHPTFKKIKFIGTPNITEDLTQRMLALPLHLGLKKNEIKIITSIINSGL